MKKDETVTYFAQTDYRNKQTPFGIKREDRTRHMYVIGKTGMGKSTLLENLAIQDIQNGEGLAFVDPHGGTAEKLLSYVPPERINDVIYFAPFDLEYPIAFNIMEDVGYDKRHLVANGLMSAFEKIWQDQWSARMAYILNNTILALLEYPDSTLLSVNKMLVDKEYRNTVVENVSDPSVKAFWTQEFAKYTDRYAQEATPAIQNKIGQFTSNPLIRNIVGQAHSSFDFREVMDQKKILIINLSKGRMGEQNANLLGSMLVTKIYLSAMSRADLSDQELDKLPNFYFYVDEFQSFANESFSDILSEARKYKLNLTIAHQYVEQMPEEVRAAVFGNVGTMIIFRIGSYDAEIFEKEFAPQFTAGDIVNLSARQIYLRLMIDNMGSQPFSAQTLPPIPMPESNSREDILTNSRRNFATKRAEVESSVALLQAPTQAKPKPRNTQNTQQNAQQSTQNQQKRQDFDKSKTRDFPKDTRSVQRETTTKYQPPSPDKRPSEKIGDPFNDIRHSRQNRYEKSFDHSNNEKKHELGEMKEKERSAPEFQNKANEKKEVASNADTLKNALTEAIAQHKKTENQRKEQEATQEIKKKQKDLKEEQLKDNAKNILEIKPKQEVNSQTKKEESQNSNKIEREKSPTKPIEEKKSEPNIKEVPAKKEESKEERKESQTEIQNTAQKKALQEKLKEAWVEREKKIGKKHLDKGKNKEENKNAHFAFGQSKKPATENIEKDNRKINENSFVKPPLKIPEEDSTLKKSEERKEAPSKKDEGGFPQATIDPSGHDIQKEALFEKIFQSRRERQEKKEKEEKEEAQEHAKDAQQTETPRKEEHDAYVEKTDDDSKNGDNTFESEPSFPKGNLEEPKKEKDGPSIKEEAISESTSSEKEMKENASEIVVSPVETRVEKTETPKKEGPLVSPEEKDELASALDALNKKINSDIEHKMFPDEDQNNVEKTTDYPWQTQNDDSNEKPSQSDLSRRSTPRALPDDILEKILKVEREDVNTSSGE